MPIGPGKYDDLATLVHSRTKAIGVVLMVVGGTKGGGFSVQGPLDMVAALPGMLRNLARDIERDLCNMRQKPS